jgi:hypothetical protein
LKLNFDSVLSGEERRQFHAAKLVIWFLDCDNTQYACKKHKEEKECQKVESFCVMHFQSRLLICSLTDRMQQALCHALSAVQSLMAVCLGISMCGK